MGILIDFLPSAEMVRNSLGNCPECNCRKKYLQIYKYGRNMKIRCPKCNYYVVEDCEQRLISEWNKAGAITEV